MENGGPRATTREQNQGLIKDHAHDSVIMGSALAEDEANHPFSMHMVVQIQVSIEYSRAGGLIALLWEVHRHHSLLLVLRVALQ